MPNNARNANNARNTQSMTRGFSEDRTKEKFAV